MPAGDAERFCGTCISAVARRTVRFLFPRVGPRAAMPCALPSDGAEPPSDPRCERCSRSSCASPAERRQAQLLRELAAAIDVGDAAYRRLCDRLDDFGNRLTVVRLALCPTAAGRPAVHA